MVQQLLFADGRGSLMVVGRSFWLWIKVLGLRFLVVGRVVGHQWSWSWVTVPSCGSPMVVVVGRGSWLCA